MEKLLLSIIIASGMCAISPDFQHQYHFVYDRKNFTEAQSYCREKYTDLATISTREDMEILNNMAEIDKMFYSHENYRAWIGLYDAVDTWRWSLSDPSFYKDGETEFRRWMDGRPDNYQSEENCTVMFEDGRWNDFDCEKNINVGVCMNVTGTNVAFIRTAPSLTWPDAQKHCREKYTDLATVRNMEDNNEILKLLGPGSVVWLGLYRDAWKWSDGNNQSFHHWAPDEPTNSGGNEFCVAANFGSSGIWEDWECHFQRAFVCYSVVPVSRQMMKVKLKMKNSSVDPNDPVVMENMLKKLKQRLKDQGLNENVKLSWRKQPDGKVFHKEEKETKSDSCRNTEL